MCDLRFWLLRGLGVEAPATARAEFHFRGALLVGIVGLSYIFFLFAFLIVVCYVGFWFVLSAAVLYCVVCCLSGGQRENHVRFAALVVAWAGCGSASNSQSS